MMIARTSSHAVQTAFRCGLLALAALASLALATAPASRWDERLARLDPVRPMDYLELGEEVAERAESDDERRLARQLAAKREAQLSRQRLEDTELAACGNLPGLCLCAAPRAGGALERL